MATDTLERPAETAPTIDVEERTRISNAAKLRKAFAWIDRHDAWGDATSVSPLCDNIQLRFPAFVRIFAGRTVEEEDRGSGMLRYAIVEDGIEFTAYEQSPARTSDKRTVTLPAHEKPRV